MSRRRTQSKFFLCSAILLSSCNSFLYVPQCRSSPWSISAINLESITDLESMTVKELRNLLQSVPMERGVLSKLKRKNDMIQYLKQQQSSSSQQPMEQPSEKQQTETNEEAQPQTAMASEISNKNGKQPQAQSSLPQRLMDQPSEKQQTDDNEETQPQTVIPLTPKTANNNGEQPQARIGNMPPLEENGYTDNNGEGPPSIIKSSRWDHLQEAIYKQYPTLRDLNGGTSTGLGDQDIRQMYHPVMESWDFKTSNNTFSDMDIITIGTASCVPGITRGVSCTALRLQMNERGGAGQGTWLFDVGESTQLQAQRTNRIRMGKISKIFLTHNHGDHTFGLPGVLCLMGQNWDRENDPPIDIYGPVGLRMWLRVAIRYSVSRIVPPYRVHELHDVPYSPDWRFDYRQQRYRYSRSRHPEWIKGRKEEDPNSWTVQSSHMPLEVCSKFGELEGGRDIYPDYNHAQSYNGAPVWEVCDDGNVKVHAAPMSHTIPCVGYVVKEDDKPGRLRSDLVEPIVKRNLKALLESGLKNPMKAMAVIKNLPEGAAFTFPDGTVVHQHEAVEPPRPGRKVVICGDTADATTLTNLGKNADVLVHEATNSYIDFFDFKKNPGMLQREAISHGHSTPDMAARFAKKIGAKKLVLNHFSPRYKGDAQIDSMTIMAIVEKLAMKASGMTKDQVVAAWDFMLLPISSRVQNDE